MDDIEKIVYNKLLTRGFTKEHLLNNRGLIGATIDLTIDAAINKNVILAAIKKQNITKSKNIAMRINLNKLVNEKNTHK